MAPPTSPSSIYASAIDLINFYNRNTHYFRANYSAFLNQRKKIQRVWNYDVTSQMWRGADIIIQPKYRLGGLVGVGPASLGVVIFDIFYD